MNMNVAGPAMQFAGIQKAKAAAAPMQAPTPQFGATTQAHQHAAPMKAMNSGVKFGQTFNRMA